MIKFNHKGDFITFASLAMAVCPELVSKQDRQTLARCHQQDGSVVRYPNVDESMSRSSISPDGLMTGMFSRTVTAEGGKYPLPNWFWHCFKRGGFMKGWGSKQYRFMGIPMLVALSLRLGLPLIPQPIAWAKSPKCRGYRADQAAMVVLLDIVHRNKVTKRHKKFMYHLFMRQVHESPLVGEMYRKTGGKLSLRPYEPITDDDRHDWGSCPGPVYRALIEFVKKL